MINSSEMAKILPKDSIQFEQLIRRQGNEIPLVLIAPNLIEDLAPYWAEATQDLISPAPEAVNRLLDEISTLHLDEAI